MNAAQYIALLSERGDRYGSLLLEFLERYGLNGLYQATADQLREFCRAKGLLVEGVAK